MAGICIEDPLRPEAVEVIAKVKNLGISKVVMMTGDSDRVASAIAKKVGVDEYHSVVMPEDKASFVEKEKAKGFWGRLFHKDKNGEHKEDYEEWFERHKADRKTLR